MTEYATAIQQKFLEEDEAPEDNTQHGRQSTSHTPEVSIPPLPADAVLLTGPNQGVLATTELPLGEDWIVLDADLDDLFAWFCTFFLFAFRQKKNYKRAEAHLLYLIWIFNESFFCFSHVISVYIHAYVFLSNCSQNEV